MNKTTRRSFIKQSTVALGMLAAPSMLYGIAGADEAAKVLLPPGAKITGSFDQSQGSFLANDKKASVISGAIAAATPGMVLRAQVGHNAAGKAGGLTLTLQDVRNKTVDIYIRVADAQKDVYPDAIIRVGWPGGWGTFYARPNPKFYDSKEMEKRKTEWLKRPGASESTFTLELRPAEENQTQLWLNGVLMQLLSTPQPFVSYSLAVEPGGMVESLQLQTPVSDPSLFTVPLSLNPRTAGMENARLSVNANARLPESFQHLTDTAAGIAIDGLGNIPGLGNGELHSLFWDRSAADNLPEQRLFTVPQEIYSSAYVLCALDDEPEKVNSFTLRVTRYGPGRGSGMADTIVTVPRDGDKEIADARQVGKVSYDSQNGRKEAPLWLLKVPVKSGLIQDIIYDDQSKSNNVGTYQYLDVEMFDPLLRVEQDEAFPPVLDRPTNRTYSPTNHVMVNTFNPAESRDTVFAGSPRSAVHIFGLALEKSPATLYVRANTDFQAFYASDKPIWNAKVAARQTGKYMVQWEFADVDGKIVESSQKTVQLDAGKEETVSIPVNTGTGWFATRFQLLDGAEKVLLDHRSSFVFLPPDSRKAGYESPFGTWLFWEWHGGAYVLDRQGPLLQRAGLRRTTSPDIWPQADTTKYGFTKWAVPWFRSRETDLQKRVADHQAYIEKNLELWPDINRMLVWHESGSGDASFPAELWGGTPDPPSEKAEAAWKDRMEYVTALAQMVRQKFPKLKMQYGNDGSSLGIIAGLLRRKFPRQYIDTIASENVGQTIAPEKPTYDGLQATWYLREVARKLGYTDIPVSACFEWMNRREKTLGMKMQGDWYVRDALHGLAYGFTMIALGTLYDASNGYYHSTWGNGGLAFRYPYMQPKPSYAALATLTRVIDNAKFQRAVPTGSTSLYALEFQHPEYYKRWIYAFFVPRGHREVTVNFEDEGTHTVIDTYGRQSVQKGKTAELEVSTGAIYLISQDRITSVSGGRSWFPLDTPPAKQTIVDAMDKAANWSIAPDPDPRLERTGQTHGSEMMPHRTKGNFVLREVNDPEKGQCLELELNPQGDIWVGMVEYAMLKLQNPVVVKGNFGYSGIWVKGNGAHGEVMWELENAKGKKYFSAGYWQDWPEENATCFEGWRLMRLAIPAGEDWADGVNITGIAATIPRNSLYLTDMAPVQNKTLRFKDICLY